MKRPAAMTATIAHLPPAQPFTRLPLPVDVAARWTERADDLPMRRRCLRAKQVLFHSGQAAGALYLVHAGSFKTTVVSADGGSTA